jgi:hypothetical protein
MHEESLVIRRRLGNKGEIAHSLPNLAYAVRNVGDSPAKWEIVLSSRL